MSQEHGVIEGDLGIIDQGYWLSDENLARLKSRFSGQVQTHTQTTNVLAIDTPTDYGLKLIGDNTKTLITMPHRDITSRITDFANERGIKILALDEAREGGERVVECLKLTGLIGASQGIDRFFSLNGRSPKSIALLGSGNIARGAEMRLSAGLYKFERIPRVDRRRILVERILDWDIIINGINWPMDLRGGDYLLRESDVRKMRRGSVIIDLDVDYAGMGPIETCSYTTPDDPFREVHGVTHGCVWGWPRLRAVEAGNRYFHQISEAIRKCQIPQILPV